MCVYVHMCKHRCKHRCLLRPEAPDSMELELQEAVNHSTWMLVAELRFPLEEHHVLSTA